MRLRMICLMVLVCSAGALAQCTLDLNKGRLANETIALGLPQVGEQCQIELEYEGTVIAPRMWYYCVARQAQGDPDFRSTGTVQSIKALENTRECAAVRITCLTDDPHHPDRGTFILDYWVERGSRAVRHEMKFIPKRPQAMSSCSLFVSTGQVTGDTHRLHWFEEGSLTATPAQSSKPYGRLGFSTDPAFAALEEKRASLAFAVGASSSNLKTYMYSTEFKRFELAWSGGYIAPNVPANHFVLLAVGPDVQRLAGEYDDFIASIDTTHYAAEPALPAPDLRAESPEPALVQAIDPGTGALTRLDAGAGNMLAEPGGIVFVEWPEQRRMMPDEGRATMPSGGDDGSRWRWQGGGLHVMNQLSTDGPLQWSAEVRNDTERQRLLEVRLELPLSLTEGYIFDGMRLVQFDRNSGYHEMTTLVPGSRLSQGIFPAVCVHDGESGVAIGMPPMHIESFYGARLERSEDGGRTLSYVLRWTLPPGETRTARFVMYAIDPRWSWRSMVARYWEAWPEVFAAPERDDVWGLFSAARAPSFLNQGDAFIERCRRLRVGGLELYAPFAKTGDFYPNDPPVYHTDDVQTHEQMRQAEETANIAACNLSYVIPTKCERQMALEQHRDSIIRNADGSLFMLDSWTVLAGEKLAGMFAYGNSYGERLRREILDILEHYKPDGFYFDNGAFVWEDYGRETSWRAFDDEGRAYTNGGIPYAMLQDYLEHYAPEIHRNPGEFIQYFSGFRGHSHLTNIVDSQQHYVRSHRLIMGYKPIFPGNPSRNTGKQQLYDFLELAGLPWLVGTQTQLEPLAQAWAPIAVELAKAGWRPVTNAVADSSDVRLERFGDPAEGAMLYTVRNLSDQTVSTVVTIRGEFPWCSVRYPLRTPEVQVEDGLTRATLEVPPREMEFLKVAVEAPPPDAATPAGPQLLEDARPLSIVVPAEPSDAEMRMARRVRGFVLVQAELLEKEPTAEIVRGEGNATQTDRVIIEETSGEFCETPDDHTVVLQFSDEARATKMLSDMLDTIAVPYTDEPAKWLP